MNAGLEIQLIAILVACACSITGTFLMLRQMAMMSDSITHTILLGIVLAFFIVHDLSSPILIVGAALMGVITVYLTELLIKTKLVAEDSSIGIIFPLLFSLAIILISHYAGTLHLDTDTVLLGELAFAPFDRITIGDMDIGAKGIYTALSLLILNILFVALHYKELMLATFDPVLAAVLGFSPALIHYALMTVVSITAVGAFEAVGSVLVVAFMIGPPMCGYLLTDKLPRLLLISAVFAILTGVTGYQLAIILDVSIAGSMAMIMGLLFIIVFLISPKRGLIASLKRRKRLKIDFDSAVLLMHITKHHGLPEAKHENDLSEIVDHLDWDTERLKAISAKLISDGKIKIEQNSFVPTQLGITTAKDFGNKY